MGLAMRVAFRCDASAQMGVGHLMRCLTLAEALREKGAECRFYLAPPSAPQATLAKARSFSVTMLALEAAPEINSSLHDPPMAHWAPWGWQADASAFGTALDGDGCDLIVVDHYALDRRWHDAMRDASRRILAIDDMADRLLAANIVLDHNASATEVLYAPRLARPASLLLGPSFALIRPETAAFRKSAPTIKQVRRILVTFGGAASADVYEATAHALLQLPNRPLEITLVGISDAKARARIAALSERGLTIAALGFVDDMARRCAEADLCVGAAGVSALERALIGVPSLTYVTAGNQRLAIAALAQAGAIIDMGDIATFSASALVDSIQRLTYMPDLLQAMAECGQRLVPTGGPQRVAEVLFNG
jgi:UDP-2,4-diacetamido-2,4,6-trideoxy-beta-L-altropyranose hydrolase